VGVMYGGMDRKSSTLLGLLCRFCESR